MISSRFPRHLAFVVAIALAVTAVSCGGDRLRNAGIEAGTKCSIAGKTQGIPSGNIACARRSGKLVWVAVNLNSPGMPACRKPGSTRVVSSSKQVCAQNAGKYRWMLVVAADEATSGVSPSTSTEASLAPAPTSLSEGQLTVGNSNSSAGSQTLVGTPTTDRQAPSDVTNGGPSSAGSMDVPEAKYEAMEWNLPAVVYDVEKSVDLSPATVASGRRVVHRVVNGGSSGCKITEDGTLLTFTSTGTCVIGASPDQSPGFVNAESEKTVTIASGCIAAIRCKVGERGPGGGVVVYAAATPQRWGSYIESAPSDWGALVPASLAGETSGGAGLDPRLVLCQVDAAIEPYRTAMDDKIGGGASNTAQLVAAGCNAAKVVVNSQTGGQTDWVIPSKGDLDAICTYLKGGESRANCIDPTGKANAAGFSTSTAYYWSSTFADGTNAAFRRMASTVMGFSNFLAKTPLWVHPVRYFGQTDQQEILIYPRFAEFGSEPLVGAYGGSGTGDVSFKIGDAGSAGCTIENGKLEANDLGTCVIIATKAGSGKYVTSSTSREVTVFRGHPRMYVYGQNGFAGRSQTPIRVGTELPPGLPDVTIEVVDQGTTDCWITGHDLRATKPGNCSVRAVYDGDTRYYPGTSVAWTFKFNDSCEAGGQCFITDIGPGGGRIFLQTGQNTWFSDSLTDQPRRFLEVAPADWYETISGSKPSGPWGCAATQLLAAESKRLGDGSKNSAEVLSQCSSNNVFKAVAAYRGGGYSDWYVPSLVELNQLCKFAYNLYIINDWLSTACAPSGRPMRDDFTPGLYWSSTQVGASLAMAMLIGHSDLLPDDESGARLTLKKDVAALVRPVRSFCRGYCPVFGAG